MGQHSCSRRRHTKGSELPLLADLECDLIPLCLVPSVKGSDKQL